MNSLSLNLGFVFYEGDCFGRLKNPYIPLDEKDASAAQGNQRKLAGIGLEERRQITRGVEKLVDGEIGYEKSGVLSKHQKMFYKAMCDDIQNERKRIGGNWAIAHADLCLKGVRQFVRECLGPDLLIITLNLTVSDLRKRIEHRHDNEEVVDWLMVSLKISSITPSSLFPFL